MHYRNIIFLYFLIWAILFAAGNAVAQPSECATVVIEIKQRMTLERQGFKAHMRINNGLSGKSLQDVQIEINVMDNEGNPVQISSDPDNTSSMFFIRPESEGLSKGENDAWTASDVGASSKADLRWMLIPSPGASKGLESGTYYSVGAKLSYTINGEKHETRVAPDSIRVKPMPKLTLDYFLPEQVYGDDAFTQEVEPPVPFALGVRVRNNGNGTAENISIDSAQPRIVSNEQGLEIGFNIRGSYVDAEPARDSLLVDFGDIDPQSCSMARWIMTCSLSGRFTDFTASFSHADSLGGKMTSLLQNVHTHSLVRDVLVDIPGRDKVRDFLARDGDAYRVYESNGVDSRVTDLSEKADLEQDISGGKRYILQISSSSGFIYVQLPDPQQGNMELDSVIRSDGKRIKPENVWLSKTRKEDPTQGWNHHLNVFDSNSSGKYHLEFKERDKEPQKPIIYNISDKNGRELEQLSFTVQASDPEGSTPRISAQGLPSGAEFTDRGEGTAVFDWTPALGQAGNYTVHFIASDGDLNSRIGVDLDIAPGEGSDTDEDGLPDSWEQKHFGSLDARPDGDWDGDGVSNIQEWRQGTDPCESNLPPEIPQIKTPTDGAEVNASKPELMVHNSEDPDQDPLQYIFQVYSDQNMTEQISSSGKLVQGNTKTSWYVQTELEDNQDYYWRVRAYDGTAYSLWNYGHFRVNTENDPPREFSPSHPEPGKAVDTKWPLLVVDNSIDPDDSTSYDFRVSSNKDMNNTIASVSDISHGSQTTTSWRVDTELKDGERYYWEAVAHDGHGKRTVSGPHSFRVNTNNSAPSEPEILAPGDGEINATRIELQAGNTTDPDEDRVYCVFQVDTSRTFDSPDLIVSDPVSLQEGQASFNVLDLQDHTRYYWRVKATDGRTDSAWSRGSFRVNRSDTQPGIQQARNPGNKSWVQTPKPKLNLLSGNNRELEQIEYEYEIYSAFNSTHPVRENSTTASSWTLKYGLQNRQWYNWRVRTVNENGNQSEWKDMGSFFVLDNKENDPPFIEFTEPLDRRFVTDKLRIAWEDRDPDDNADISLYYAPTKQGRNGTKIISGLKEDPDGTSNEYVWDLESVPEGTYLLYAHIEDSEYQEGVYAPGRVVVDHTAPKVKAEPAGGLFTPPRTVNVEFSAEEPVSIYYTRSGSDPDQKSLTYRDSIFLNQTTQLKVLAVDRAGNRGKTSTFTYKFISPEPQPPQADAGSNRVVNEESVVTLDGSSSFDPDGEELSCSWSQKEGPNAKIASRESCLAEVEIPDIEENGTELKFELEVTDADGLTDQDSLGLQVKDQEDIDPGNRAPEAPEPISPIDGEAGIPLRAELNGSTFSDPDPGDEHARTRWQLSTDPEFESLLVDIKTTRKLTAIRLPALMLDDESTYHWKFRYVDEHGAASPWSVQRTFSTAQSFGDDNGNGVPDDLEVNAPLDLDSNGKADHKQEDITTLVSANKTNKFGLKTGENASLIKASTHKLSGYNATPESPENMTYGLVSVQLDVPPGSTAKLRLYSSEKLPEDGTWHKKVSGKGWRIFSGNVEKNGQNSVILQLQDGGEGDADNLANGRIIDPFGVSGKVTDDSSDFGGCIFDPSSNAGLGWIFPGMVVLICLAAGFVSGRRRRT